MATHTWVNRVLQVAPRSEQARIVFLENVIRARRAGASRKAAVQLAAIEQTHTETGT